MIALKIHNGAGFRTITEESIDNLGILQRNGEYQYFPFMGFISLVAAKKVNRFVKANIAAYCIDYTHNPEWFDTKLLLGTVMDLKDSAISIQVFIVLDKGVPVPVESEFYRRW